MGDLLFTAEEVLVFVLLLALVAGVATLEAPPPLRGGEVVGELILFLRNITSLFME